MTPEYGPWNPGLESEVPFGLRHLSTIFRAANVFTDMTRARELHDLTGLAESDLVAFRPERLALHEVLIRVTADISVPDGRKIGDLGINFRRMVGGVLASHVEPRMAEIAATYDAARKQLAGFIDTQLPAAESCLERRAEAADTPRGAAHRALARVVSAVLVRHGRLWGERSLIGAVATDIACNDFAAREIGGHLAPWIADAARREGFEMLPRQDHPVVMNTKGPSASGKSTLRPLQKTLAADIGVRWNDFSLVSPDIWRKQLLDYESLGADYKYAAPLTGEELRIVDMKLDRYMAHKAASGNMSHLLIDRFRFDSFAPDSDEAGSNLLTRFGRIVYLFFMITPPRALVERAWARGLEFGRYKAVEDTLAHGVEAYSGMPQLFFTWIERRDKRVHFEFLDNSVPLGERPRTVAFGWNDILNVLDVKSILDVERFRRVNVHARSPDGLWPDATILAPEKNAEFLRQCLTRFREVQFARQATGRVYLRLEQGRPVWVDRDALEEAMRDADARAGLMATVPAAFDAAVPRFDPARQRGELVAAERIHTLGRWGMNPKA